MIRTATCFLLFVLLAGVARGQESRPKGLETVPVVLELRAVDATAAWSDHSSSGPASRPKEQPIADAKIVVMAMAQNGEQERIEAQTDLEGRFSVDLGPRYRGTEISVYAITTKDYYMGLPLTVGQTAEPDLVMYTVRSDAQQLRQQIMRIVTEQPEDDRSLVHVRQVVSLTNRTFSVFHDLGTGGYVYPVPEGAQITSLRVNGRDVVDKTVAEREGWGRGITIPQQIFPANAHRNAILQIIGTYTFDVEENDEIHLGFSSPVPTVGFLLALEKMRFTYLPAGTGRDLQPGQPLGNIPGVTQEMVSYELGEIPGGSEVVARVRFGKPPVETKAIVITVGLILGLVLAIVLGVALGRRRPDPLASGVAPDDVLGQLTELDRRLARGEIDDEEYHDEQQRLAGPLSRAEPSRPAASRSPVSMTGVARELDAIANAEERSAEQLAKDVQTLARIVREHLSAEDVTRG